MRGRCFVNNSSCSGSILIEWQVLSILLYQLIQMGPKASTAHPNEYSALLQDYEIVRQIDSEGLFFMKDLRRGGDYLLRELTFNDRKEFDRFVDLFQKRKVQLSGCKYVVPLQKVITKSEDQYCSTFYKIYALYQFTERTLEDEISQRNLQKRKFQQKQLWSILASCIVGMSHLQKQGIKHQSLRSNTILISQEGVIKVYDPLATGCQTNYDTLISKRNTPHLYLSPELADALQLETGVPHANHFKSDIWTMAMILLEAGLNKYQDQCYRDDSARVHWETVQYNVHLFRQNYSEELAALLQFMLSREEKNRPDWLELQERVIKEEESRISQQNITRDSNASRLSERPFNPINYNPPPDKKPYQDTSSILITQTPQPEPPVRTMTKVAQPATLKTVIRTPLAESNASKTQISMQLPIQFKPSSIQSSRPLRNIFPVSNYSTQTKVDQNLIIVTQEERYSDVEDTPNNRTHSSYFDSNLKNNLPPRNQQQPFYNTFTPTNPPPQEKPRQPQINTYGVSVFQTQTQPFHPTVTFPPPTFHLQPYQTATTQIYHPPPGTVQTYQPLPAVSQLHIDKQPQTIKVQSQPPAFEHVSQARSGLFSTPAVSQPSGTEEGEYVVQRYKQGSEYKGYKWEGMRHGFGVFYYQDGGMYEGEWRFNKMQGKGKLFYQSGKLAYEGDWANDQFEGRGKLYNQYPEIVRQPLNFKNLDDVQEMWTLYQGDFRSDLKNGHGILFLTNGEFYEGGFQQDYAHGQGVYHTINGDQIHGRWDKNLLIE